MDENLSLDEIIELRRKRNPNFARDGLPKPTNFVGHRNRTYQRTPRERNDAPNTSNQRKWRPRPWSSPSPVKAPRSIRWEPAPLRENNRRSRNMNMRNNMEAARNDDASGLMRFGRGSPHPRRYVDLDNMQELEDEQIIRALQAGGKRRKRPPSPAVIINLDSDDDSYSSSFSPPRSRSHRSKRARTDGDHGHRRRQSMNELGFRLLISNLNPTVTSSDIREIFSDAGTLYEAKVIRPGTAEVVYKSLEDAQSAVFLYHRRELDGQAMHCELISSPSAAEEVDVDVIHTVLFGRKKECRPLFSGRIKHRK